MVNKDLSKLKNKKNIHIVGAAGIEGSAVACFLADVGIKDVTLHDFSPKEEFEDAFKSARDYLKKDETNKAFKRLINTGYKICHQEEYLKEIEKADLIFVSQGWFRYESNQELKQLKGKIPFSSITKLYFQLSPCPIIGITGTVGKSTTTRLIYQMLKECGADVYISGNDRDNPPVLDKLLTFSKSAFLILEISNRQLIGLNYSPHIAVVTNIFPNHLDDHKSFKNYIAAKRNIVAHQKKGDFAVLNYDNEVSKNFSRETRAKTIYYSYARELKKGISKKDTMIIIDGKREVLDIEKLKLMGRHNALNVMATVAVGNILKLDLKCMQRTLYAFRGLKHRLQKIREVNKVDYIEDSQSTNPNSTIGAVDALRDKKIILIAGGFRPKFSIDEFKGMVQAFSEPSVKKVFLIGKIASVLYKEHLRQNGRKEQVEICPDLATAVKKASDIAKPSEVVILSPGVESFGEFKDYRERGEKFKEFVNEISIKKKEIGSEK